MKRILGWTILAAVVASASATILLKLVGVEAAAGIGGGIGGGVAGAVAASLHSKSKPSE